MVRPRVGNFLYSNGELETMREDVEAFKQAGVAGVVIGALTSAGAVDLAVVAELVALYYRHECTLTYSQAGRGGSPSSGYAARVVCSLPKDRCEHITSLLSSCL